jgi:two-component system sensor histidine kinase VicK
MFFYAATGNALYVKYDYNTRALNVFDDAFTEKTEGVSAEQKIREIKEGMINPETRILENPNEILRRALYVIDTSDQISVCSSFGWLALLHVQEVIFGSFKKVLDKYKKGEHKGIRWLGNIDKQQDVEVVKKFLDLGMQIRHTKNIPVNFSVTDKDVNLTVDKMGDDKVSSSVLISNDALYREHFTSLFEELWKNGIDAADKIKEIEGGAEPSSSEVENIHNPIESLNRAYSVAKSAMKEIMMLYPTLNSFLRQSQTEVITQLLKEIIQNGVKVRLLIPAGQKVTKMINETILMAPHLDIRRFDEILESRIAILLVDRKECMIFEVKDDTKEDSEDAIGLTTFCANKSIVSSYVAIFENLWRQSELYEQVRETNERLASANEQLALVNEQLKAHDKMQQEFINIAAHELRTPIMPILGYAELLEYEFDSIQEAKNYANIISRNAKKLERFASHLLIVSRIESNSLALNKEHLNLRDVIQGCLQDYGSVSGSSGISNIKFLSATQEEENIFVNADKDKLSQVISNLLSNAIKFTKEGCISISAEKKIQGGIQKAIVKVKDSGPGIDRDILPRLFSKFASKSYQGTGLGLFICRSIIESHGGNIWAKNNIENEGCMGATFAFSLPLIEHRVANDGLGEQFNQQQH